MIRVEGFGTPANPADLYAFTSSDSINTILDDSALMEQLTNLSRLPFLFKHIALMPDFHPGYGMPIGGVIATTDVVIPYAVGVDIGCGMCAVKTNVTLDGSMNECILETFHSLSRLVPTGEGNCHQREQEWSGFGRFQSLLARQGVKFSRFVDTPAWMDDRMWSLAKKNLGTLGGGNHFLDMLHDEDGKIWLMVHSGSRNLGHKICTYYHKLALEFNEQWYSNIPSKELAFAPVDHELGKSYIRDMSFALDYAYENRQRMLNNFKIAFTHGFRTLNNSISFEDEYNIHHNYAAQENHFGKNVWVHRKGATSARFGQIGIIPGSMGTPSYIVGGLGEPMSYTSCSHGAGRPMSRTQTNDLFNVDAANDSISHLAYFSGWPKIKRGKNKGQTDISESPLAYKKIDDIIERQSELIKPIVKLMPIGVMIGK